MTCRQMSVALTNSLGFTKRNQRHDIRCGGSLRRRYETMQVGTLITPRLAEEAIYSRLTCLPIESLPLTQCVGATMRETIYAERDQPPFDRVAMDGMAVDS